MEALGKVILYVPEEVNTKIKETIAKVKDTNNYDTNAKALSKCTKSDLQVTLAFLLWKEEGDSEIEELITDGLSFSILRRLVYLMSFQCNHCRKTVWNKHDDAITINCQMCGIGSGQDCYKKETNYYLVFFVPSL